MVEGLQVDLIHPTRLEWMSFGRMGKVRKGVGTLSITYGTKENFTFPAMLWRIEGGKLVIFKSEEEEYDRLTLVSLTETTLIAGRKSGEIARYKVQRHGRVAPGREAGR